MLSGSVGHPLSENEAFCACTILITSEHIMS